VQQQQQEVGSVEVVRKEGVQQEIQPVKGVEEAA